MSKPSVKGNGLGPCIPRRIFVSTGLSAAAWTSTRRSGSRTGGSGASAIFRTSGEPNSVMDIARMGRLYPHLPEVRSGLKFTIDCSDEAAGCSIPVLAARAADHRAADQLLDGGGGRAAWADLSGGGARGLRHASRAAVRSDPRRPV